MKRTLHSVMVVAVVLSASVSLYAALSDDLKAAWELTANVNDSHSGGFTLTNSTGVTFPSGAADFEAASSHYLTRASHADLSMGDIGFTIMAEVVVESNTAGSIVQKADADDLEFDLRLNGSGTVSFRVSSGNGFANLTTVEGPSTSGTDILVAWHDPTADTINLQVDNGAADSASHSADPMPVAPRSTSAGIPITANSSTARFVAFASGSASSRRMSARHCTTAAREWSMRALAAVPRPGRASSAAGSSGQAALATSADVHAGVRWRRPVRLRGARSRLRQLRNVPCIPAGAL